MIRQLKVVKFKSISLVYAQNQKRLFGVGNIYHCNQTGQQSAEQQREIKSPDISPSNDRIWGEILPTAKVVPVMLPNKDPVMLSFNDVPGPKSLKYLSNTRQYLSEMGTQITAAILTIGLNIGTYITDRKPLKNLSVLFDEYGPVVRFVSPVGGDIVLINHPDHIQKVFAMEGDSPIRSTLESLERYRTEHRNIKNGGLYTAQGQEWTRQRSVVYAPLNDAVLQNIQGVEEACENFARKVYNLRNYQDEISKDLYKELHKWAFDCMGLILFSKKFTMLNTDLVYSQCDMSWLYHSLQCATDAIIKCESGFHLWKFFRTPAWNSLVKNCDSLDNLIGKHVMEEEQSITFQSREHETVNKSLINAMLTSDEKMSAEDVATIIMDMLLIGVNTITSSMSFLLYNLAKYQRSQRILYPEIKQVQDIQELNVEGIEKLKQNTPYLQACIRETLRLVPPIPVLRRVLEKNITLDKYNIPRGTLIIMSTQDTALKECNYDDATKFLPERWFKDDAKDYHPFASIPFGFGTRRCLGQDMAEIVMSLLTIKILQRYKLEYHYKDIQPTRSFIARPNRSLKIRFIDRA